MDVNSGGETAEEENQAVHVASVGPVGLLRIAERLCVEASDVDLDSEDVNDFLGLFFRSSEYLPNSILCEKCV